MTVVFIVLKHNYC